jgi:hypothetical protein
LLLYLWYLVVASRRRLSALRQRLLLSAALIARSLRSALRSAALSVRRLLSARRLRSAVVSALRLQLRLQQRLQQRLLLRSALAASAQSNLVVSLSYDGGCAYGIAPVFLGEK